MALLGSRTLSTVAGLDYVNLPSGISLTGLVSVKREGTQHDKVLLADIDDGVTRQWAPNLVSRRVVFPAATPFIDGEKVFIIYKTVY